MSIPLPFSLQPGELALLETVQRDQPDMRLLAAALAFHGGATILDGGNHFNAYPVLGQIRFHTAQIEIADTLQVARAFNCHQMLGLVQAVPLNGRPCLAINLLDTFVDDAVPLVTRQRLVHQMLIQIGHIRQHQAVVVSLTAPKEEIDQWQTLAAPFRRAATRMLEEGFMGKTIPTVNQIIQQAEVILARFSRVIQPEERRALDDLFVSARKHIAAISEANSLLPFEAAQQAMLLEQQKMLLNIQERLAALEERLGP